MAVKIASSTKDLMLDCIETDIGASAVLKIRSGSPPATIATADSGDVLAEIALPTPPATDWMAAADGGVKAKIGSWTTDEYGADASGDAGHFRIYKSDGTTQMLQGSVGCTGVSGDMLLAQATVGIVEGQAVTVSTFTLTAGN